MKSLALVPSFLALLFVGLLGPAQEQHPSKASEVLATYTPAARDAPSVATMAAAANAFLTTLDDELRGECAFQLDSAERSKWTNVPPRGDEGGVRLGDLNEEQLERACDLLATVLSRQGYEQVRDVLLADDKLLRNGRPRMGFGAENFWLVLFGSPTADGEWALQLDGHHLALNLTFAGESMGMSPSFLGTQPSEYERSGEKYEPLRHEVDDAFALVNSLNALQRERAIVSAKRGRIAAGAGRDGVIPEAVGLTCRTFSAEQRAILKRLLRWYVGDLPKPHADARMLALEEEIDDMVFAWSGPIENPSDVSYRIQGPSVIIEYACQDLGGKPLDHLHSMYRDPDNEYGAGFSRGR